MDALYRACRDYPGGIEALSARMGKKSHVMYSKLRRQVETHRIGYDEELSEILFCLEEARVQDWASTLHAFCARHNHIAVPIPTLGDDEDHASLTALILNTMTKQGEVAAEINKALADDSDIDNREFVEIEERFEKTMRALLALQQWVREKHEKARQSGRVR